MKQNNSNPFAQLSKEAVGSAKVVTVKDLFTENNPHGYFSVPMLKSYLEGFSSYQQRKLALVFEYMQERHTCIGLPIPIEEPNGDETLWLKFQIAGYTPQKFKMKSSDWLIKLVKDYQKGLLRGFVFSPEEMVAELTKVQE